MKAQKSLSHHWCWSINQSVPTDLHTDTKAFISAVTSMLSCRPFYWPSMAFTWPNSDLGSVRGQGNERDWECLILKDVSGSCDPLSSAVPLTVYNTTWLLKPGCVTWCCCSPAEAQRRSWSWTTGIFYRLFVCVIRTWTGSRVLLLTLEHFICGN